MSLTVVPPRPADAQFCPTCADQRRYPWVNLIDGHCPFNQQRDRAGKVRQGGTCRLCWGHTSTPATTVCATCQIRVVRAERHWREGGRAGEAQHGAAAYMRGCRCEACTEAQRQRMTAYRAKRRAGSTPAFGRATAA